MVPRRNSMTAFDYFIVPNLCTHHLLELCVTQGEIVFEFPRACLTEQCKGACKWFVVLVQSSFQHCFHLKFHLSRWHVFPITNYSFADVLDLSSGSAYREPPPLDSNSER